MKNKDDIHYWEHDKIVVYNLYINTDAVDLYDSNLG